MCGGDDREWCLAVLVSGGGVKSRKNGLKVSAGKECTVLCLVQSLLKGTTGWGKPENQWSGDKRKAANLDQRLKSLIMSVFPDDQMNSIINCLTAKSTWDDLILYHKGPSDVKESRVMDLKLCYNTFKFKEEDTRISNEYLNDLEEEYQARALLAKSKRFSKKEEVSSDDNEMVEVKVLMALAEENDVVSKEGTRTGEWVKISMRKCDIKKPIWYLDSRCSRHMTGVKSYLHKYVEQSGPKVVFGDDSTCTTEGYGSIKCNGIVFTKVAFVNGLKGTIFNSNKEVVMIAPRVRDLYVLDMTSSAQESCFFAKASENLYWIWDKKLAHLNFKTINKPAKQNLVIGLPSLVYSKDKPCSSCEKENHHKASFKTKQTFSIKKCLYLLHMDLFGPVTLRSINHEKYSIVIVNEYSRVFNTRRQQTEETYLITFDECPDAIKFLKHLVDNINIAETERYPLDEYLHPYEPSQRWSQDKHIELVNIIGNPGARMLIRAMAKQLSAASAHECLFVDFLSKEEPKKIRKSKRGISINHEKYIKDLLKKYDINGSSVKTPMVPPNNLRPDLSGKSVNETQYRGMIGSLMYLTVSRSDIKLSTCLCARYQANPKESHLIDVKRVFRDHVLKGDIELHFIPTQYQLTNIFTKPLDEPTFKRLIVELDFISKCCLKEAFTRAPNQYKEYLSEVWYTAKTLDESKVDYAKIIWEDLIHKMNKKTREKIVPYPRFLSLLLEHMIPKYENEELTINPTQVFSVHNLTLKPNKPKEPPFTNHMKAIYNLDVHVDSKAPKPSSQTEEVPQGKKPRAKSRLRRKRSSKHTLVGEMHKEAQQVDGGPTSLGAISKEGAHPQLSSDKTKSARDGLKTANTDSGANEESRANDISLKVKLEDLSNILKDTRSAFFTPESPPDEPIIVSVESKEEEKVARDKDTEATWFAKSLYYV
uniref:Retrovirus-related Pol polyprotein from transposon TNT 1-94 n=1 Tax=Tanacetum cinerariifolium TaxID=118510 RepID=A0A699H7A7_TANCI|nr:retrovirus-related Pol polyprotein from transposon TNT 1-94 [Tanacetum cinerariifolium]